VTTMPEAAASRGRQLRAVDHHSPAGLAVDTAARNVSASCYEIGRRD
jgi:hypothetical protein